MKGKCDVLCHVRGEGEGGVTCCVVCVVHELLSMDVVCVHMSVYVLV